MLPTKSNAFIAHVDFLKLVYILSKLIKSDDENIPSTIMKNIDSFSIFPLKSSMNIIASIFEVFGYPLLLLLILELENLLTCYVLFYIPSEEIVLYGLKN